MEEERRLAFVAATRAREKLFISEAEGEKHSDGFRFPSRFIFDMDKKNLDTLSPPPDEMERRAKAYIKTSEDDLRILEKIGDIKIGDAVGHAILGRGTVMEIDARSRTFSIKFEGLPTPRKISFRAPIKKLQD